VLSEAMTALGPIPWSGAAGASSGYALLATAPWTVVVAAVTSAPGVSPEAKFSAKLTRFCAGGGFWRVPKSVTFRVHVPLMAASLPGRPAKLAIRSPPSGRKWAAAGAPNWLIAWTAVLSKVVPT